MEEGPSTTTSDLRFTDIPEAALAIASSPSFDWNVVPDYLKKYVAVFLRYSDILALCDSSKSVREEICEDDFFWKMKTKHDFEVEYDYPPWPRENWEEDYRFYMGELENGLIIAIKAQDVAKVKDLIEFGVDINSRSGFEEYTPLMRAVRVGNLELVKLLLENGAHVNAKTTRNRNTALHMATYGGMGYIVQVLLEYGADVKAKNRVGSEAIIVASDNSHSLKLVDMLLERGADINNVGQYGNTLLLYASLVHRGDYIQGLIDRGAEVNVQDTSPRKYTPLIKSVQFGNVGVVRVLLDNGADITVRDGRGNTVLDLVNSRGYIRSPRRPPRRSQQVRRMIREAWKL